MKNGNGHGVTVFADSGEGRQNDGGSAGELIKRGEHLLEPALRIDAVRLESNLCA
jgi:hypothetical protein